MLTVLSFSGKLILNGVLEHSYASIKTAIFKTVRRLNRTCNFARSITTSIRTEVSGGNIC